MLRILDAIDRDLREARARIDTPPTRFYFNVTELCQLRCSHCITHAPELTQSGRARHMLPEVVEALRPHLKHLLYAGLTHAGEPILSPVLDPLLAAIQEARDGAATAVHLLSNGVALTPARMAELVALGVSSISISIDGMSEATQDSLRIGSRIAHLLPRIRELAALRRERFPEVRLGIAWTVTRSNAGEIPALVRFAVEAGLSWVKLEETYPINACAAFEASIAPEQVREAVAGAERLAESLGLPLLDHTHDVTVWKCRLAEDPAMARFSRLDDLVNRMEINPCRFPLEVICVEPNGDVKPLDFHHPPAGNLLETDLSALWRSPPFVEARDRVHDLRLCGRSTPTCAPDPGPSAW